MASQWQRAAEFAEYADALAITTAQIMAVLNDPDAGLATVIYESPQPGPVWGVALRRDADGILRPLDLPRQLAANPETFIDASGLDDAIRARLDDELGPRS